jgi:hypothetical protein
MDFPEPLFESYYSESPNKVCFICGRRKAESFLRTTNSIEVVPMCDPCSKDWNFYGYYTLKRIKPKKLLWNILIYKLTHFRPSWYMIYKGLKAFTDWSKRMKKFAKYM